MPQNPNHLARELLDLWFSPATEPRWFLADPAFDATLARFTPLIAATEAGPLPTAPELSPADAALAACLALDQLPRNLHRGTPRAFAYDHRAREVAADAIAEGLDATMPPERRLFVYLPFEHSEDRADQDRAVALIGALGSARWTDYAERHRAVIARFGRFPHRNAILGRPSTDAEAAFLAEPGSSF